MANRSRGKGSANQPAGLAPNRAPFEYGHVNESIDTNRRFRRGEFDSVPGMRQMRRAMAIGLGAVLLLFLVAIVATALTH